MTPPGRHALGVDALGNPQGCSRVAKVVKAIRTLDHHLAILIQLLFAVLKLWAADARGNLDLLLKKQGKIVVEDRVPLLARESEIAVGLRTLQLPFLERLNDLRADGNGAVTGGRLGRADDVLGICPPIDCDQPALQIDV